MQECLINQSTKAPALESYKSCAPAIHCDQSWWYLMAVMTLGGRRISAILSSKLERVLLRGKIIKFLTPWSGEIHLLDGLMSSHINVRSSRPTCSGFYCMTWGRAPSYGNHFHESQLCKACHFGPFIIVTPYIKARQLSRNAVDVPCYTRILKRWDQRINHYSNKVSKTVWI